MTDSTNRREALLALKGKTVSLPDLLAVFGFRVRNYQTVPVVTAELKDAGLATVPSFAVCGLKEKLLVVAETAETAEVHQDADEGDEDGELLQGTLPQHSFKIGDLPSARAGVVSVSPSSQLSDATHIMQAKNYSQIPVIDGTSGLRGVITWKSVAAKYATGTVPTLTNAMVEDVPVALVSQELFPLLPLLIEAGYLLVLDENGSYSGIVTAADITARFHATALPFFLVGEIEFGLRKCLGAKLSPDAIRAVQHKNKQTGNIADLMFGQYVRLLREDENNPTLSAQADANWAALGWTGVSRRQFVHALSRVKDIRNKIAHFDNEPLTEQLITELVEFSGLLKMYM
ncbi:CBS domain-containing protein [Streptantibioticus rubrisoli]|uniref:CBS domain-containing protein n=1 Tax=Streptantibioticus rubrisoli TaxID=1387313 RepID=A0ABT1PCZ7_9ACTN|nr:CBS domain-containing protein [Streptantibioticus rubrisoli]MCQ4043241.1 CBS domain-containing protein [Streptantibioticus rubrisoli]